MAKEQKLNPEPLAARLAARLAWAAWVLERLWLRVRFGQPTGPARQKQAVAAWRTARRKGGC